MPSEYAKSFELSLCHSSPGCSKHRTKTALPDKMQTPRIDLLRDCKTKAPAGSNAKSNPFKRTAAATPAQTPTATAQPHSSFSSAFANTQKQTTQQKYAVNGEKMSLLHHDRRHRGKESHQECGPLTKTTPPQPTHQQQAHTGKGGGE